MGRPGLPVCLSLFLLTCVLYAGSLRNGFHYDDFHAVVRNPHIRDPARIPSFFLDPQAFSENPESAMYRPLLLLTFALDRAVFGDRPAGYHAVNVALHGLAAVAILQLLTALGFARPVAIVAGVLFAVHPIQTEAVCYVSSRSEVLMAGLFLAACIALLRSGDASSRWTLALAAVAGAGSLLAKSVAVVLPAAAALCDACVGGAKRLRRGAAGYLLLTALSLAYVACVREQATRALVEAPVRPASAQAWTQLKAIAYYTRLTAFPVHLTVEHQFEASRGPEPAAVLSGLLLASAGLVGASLWRRVRWLPFAGAWWLLLLLPASVVPLIVLVNEHRLYTSTAGFVLAVAICLCDLRRASRRRGRAVAAIAIGAYTSVFATMTWQRVRVWESELTLWADAARQSPLMLRPHLRYADALVSVGRREEARDEYLGALALRPHHPATRNNLGLFYEDEGRVGEAEEQYRALLRVSPDNLPARMNLAGLLLRRGAWSEARAQCDSALVYGGTRGRAQALLGQIALLFERDPGRALDRFDAAIAAGAGDDADVQIGRGVALRSLGRPAAAVAAYREALAIDANRGDAWYNLGNLYATTGAVDLAIAAYRQVRRPGADPDLVRRAERGIADLVGGSGPAPNE